MKKILATGLIGVSFITTAFAETAEETQKKRIEELSKLSLDELMDVEISSASRFEEKISDTPANVVVINREQIETRRYVSLNDLMRDLPGVQMQNKSYELYYNFPSFRGHTFSNKFLILQDGVRIDAPNGEPLPIAENFSLYHVKKVEIVYGPAAAVYGTDAFGGVINIITEDAQDIDGVKVSMVGGNYDYRGGYAKMGQKITDQISISASVHQQRADYADIAKDYSEIYQKVDATTYGGEVIVPAAQREAFVAPIKSRSLHSKIQIADHATLGFQQNFFRNPSTAGEAPNLTLYNKDLIWDTLNNNVYLKYNHTFNNALKTNLRLEYSDYEIGNQSKFKNIYCEFVDCYIYAKGRKQGFEQQWQYLFGEKHQLTGGLSYADHYSLPKTTDLPKPYNTSKGATEQNLYHIGTNNSLPIDMTELNYHTRAAYFQIQSAWDKQWSSMVGLRYDYSSRYGETLNPRVGMVFRPNNKTVLKLLYGEAFRAPSALDTSEVYGIFSGLQNDAGQYMSFYFHAPNLNLKPEKARTLEFNALHRFDEHFTMQLSAYYTRLNNLILSINDANPVQFIPNGQILVTESNRNVGTGHQYGSEISLAWNQKLNDQWKMDLWGNYSFLKGKSKHPSYSFELDLPYTSLHNLKLGATFKYQNKYFITAKMRANSPIYMLSPDPTVNKHQDVAGNAVFDLHFGAPIMKNLSATLDVYNALSTRYYNASLLYPNNAAPQPLLEWRLSLHYRF